MLRGITEEDQLNRDQVMRGTLTFPDPMDVFYYGSGSPTKAEHPSCPLGSSLFGGIQPAPHLPGGEGYLLIGPANGYDPKVGRNRKDIMIHRGRSDDPDLVCSWGCIAIVNYQFDEFKRVVQRYLTDNGLYINIRPSGAITITLSPEYNPYGQVV